MGERGLEIVPSVTACRSSWMGRTPGGLMMDIRYFPRGVNVLRLVRRCSRMCVAGGVG